jgi:hypothetical protein
LLVNVCNAGQGFSWQQQQVAVECVHCKLGACGRHLLVIKPKCGIWDLRQHQQVDVVCVYCGMSAYVRTCG